MKTMKTLFAAAAAVLMSFGVFAAPMKPIATVSADKTTLTFTTAPMGTAPLGVAASYWMTDGDFERDANDYPKWHDYAADITTVVFMSDFGTSAKPTDCHLWFADLSNLETVTDLPNLNTALVTDMFGMFSGCSSLTMLSVKGFDMTEVGDMGEMFKDCSSLRRIIGPMANIDSGADSASMFEGCTALVGGYGTGYDSACIGKEYARVDADGEPGYFSLEAKAVWDKTKHTLTFVYDATDYGTKDTDWFSVAESEADDPTAVPPWHDENVRNDVTEIVFDESFVDYKPLHCGFWFADFGQLENIDLEYLYTDAARSIRGMFNNCSKLKEVNFDTGEQGFITSKVEDMSMMFDGCGALETIAWGSEFDTSSVTDMRKMFASCSSLTSIDLSCVDTSNVEDMTSLFEGCAGLLKVDLSRFDTAKVQFTCSMFGGCTSLKRIYVQNNLNLDSLLPDYDTWMFYGCESLKGGNGTAYDDTKTDKAYARLDVAGTPGYFSRPPVAVLSADKKTLTFYADQINHSSEGTVYSVAEAEIMADLEISPAWTSVGKSTVEKVVFSDSFAGYRPSSCQSWFYEFQKLAGVDGLGNLNTSEAKSMAYMFDFCPALRTLDVSHFETAGVRDMSYMFYGCDGLERIYASAAFDVAGVASSDEMFGGCTSLKGGNDTPYDATKVDKEYARLDKPGAPGYFTLAGPRTVTFDACGGTATPATLTPTVDTAIGTLPTATRTGYTFKGWFTAPVDGEKITESTVITKDVTFCAQWEGIAYSITVNLDGGTLATAVPATYTVENTITLGTPTRERYQFTGWTPDAGKIAKGSTGAKTFTAQWLRIYPSLFNDGAAGNVSAKGATYNGFIGEGELAGTFTLVVKKAKDGVADATMTIVDATSGKKRTIKGKVDIESGLCTGDLAGIALSDEAAGGSLSGSSERVQGAVDAAKAKDAAAIAVMNGFSKKVYALVIEDELGNEGMLTVTFAAKGKAKISGTVAGGKVSGNAQMSVGEKYAAMPFAYAKKGVAVSFVLWFDKTTMALYDVSGLGEGVELVAAGASDALAAGEYVFKLNREDVLDAVPNAIAETPLDIDVDWTGKKFDAGKAAKVKYDKTAGKVVVDTSKGDNVSGLALKYSKGVLSGSFTVYGLTGTKIVKNKFTVSGVAIDGKGYATGTNKKLGAIAVEVAK